MLQWWTLEKKEFDDVWRRRGRCKGVVVKTEKPGGEKVSEEGETAPQNCCVFIKLFIDSLRLHCNWAVKPWIHQFPFSFSSSN